MISITIPIYNEKENILLLYKHITDALNKHNYSWELILVNDGSTDGTREVLNELARKDQSVKVIHLGHNSGQTAAMMAGVNYAKGDVIVPMDGDLQNDPEDIPRLLEKLEQGYDVVSGWRKDRKDFPIRRNLTSRIANYIISKISGVHLHDYGCTLKAYRKEIIKGIKLYGEMHRFIPIYASWNGAKTTELPVAHHPRIHGQSKYGLSRVIKILLDLIVVMFLHHYAQKSMYIFGGAGIISFTISGLSGLWAIYLKCFENTTFIQTPLPLLFVMCFITGIMCILMGLLAELIVRTYYESQNKPTYFISETRNVEPENSRESKGT